VPEKALGELFFLVFSSFFWSHPTLLETPCSNLGLFWIFRYISLVFFVVLNFLAYFKFELQVHEVMKFLNSKNDIHYIWCMLRSYLGSHMKFRTSFCRNMTNN
jgi:hypothetical protein